MAENIYDSVSSDTSDDEKKGGPNVKTVVKDVRSGSFDSRSSDEQRRAKARSVIQQARQSSSSSDEESKQPIPVQTKQIKTKQTDNRKPAQMKARSGSTSSDEIEARKAQQAAKNQKTKVNMHKSAWGGESNAGFDDIGAPPPNYHQTQGQKGKTQGHPDVEGQSQTSVEGHRESKPLCPGIAFSILWFFAIIGIGMPVAMMIATVYVMLMPIGVCVPTFMVALDGLLFVIKLPYMFTRNMIKMLSCSAESWDIKNVNNNPA